MKQGHRRDMFLPVTHYRQLHTTNTPHTRPTPATHTTHTTHTAQHTHSPTPHPARTAPDTQPSYTPPHWTLTILVWPISVYTQLRLIPHAVPQHIHTAPVHTDAQRHRKTRNPNTQVCTPSHPDSYPPSSLSLLFLSQPVHTL